MNAQKRCKCGGLFRDKIMGDECESCGKLIELTED